MLVLVTGLPTMVNAVNTDAGTPLENESTVVKNVYAQLPLLIAGLPLMLFAVGVMLLKG